MVAYRVEMDFSGGYDPVPFSDNSSAASSSSNSSPASVVSRSESPGSDSVENNDVQDLRQETVMKDLMHEIIDEVTLGLCFEIHRSCKIGTFNLDATDEDAQKQYEIVDERGLDVFGQHPSKKQFECICPNCQRNMAASRFAPHLEKCMGMGRNSSRIASRRIANTGKQGSDNDSADDDHDNDWSYNADKKSTKKFKKDRSGSSPRRSKPLKVKNGDIPSVGSTASDGSGSFLPVYETMTLDDKKQLLMATCGVISEHTKKMCTRSHRCPQHSEEQRASVRAFLLGQNSAISDSQPADEVQVDIDSYEDGDSQSLRESLQWDVTPNPSPADSTSTINSTGSRKQKKSKHHGNKKKKSGSKSKQGVGTPSSVYEFA